jgi:hypothetical protein
MKLKRAIPKELNPTNPGSIAEIKHRIRSLDLRVSAEPDISINGERRINKLEGDIIQTGSITHSECCKIQSMIHNRDSIRSRSDDKY